MLDNVTYDSVTNKFNITFKIFAISLSIGRGVKRTHLWL